MKSKFNFFLLLFPHLHHHYAFLFSSFIFFLLFLSFHPFRLKSIEITFWYLYSSLLSAHILTSNFVFSLLLCKFFARFTIWFSFQIVILLNILSTWSIYTSFSCSPSCLSLAMIVEKIEWKNDSYSFSRDFSFWSLEHCCEKGRKSMNFCVNYWYLG